MTVLTALGAILLAVAGVAHAARPREHRAVLRVHGLLPPGWPAPATAGAEIVVGVAVLAFLLADPAGATLPVAAQTAVYCVFAGYTAVLRTRRPGVPCGCFGVGKVSWAVVARAVVLAAGSAGYAAARAVVPDRWSCVAAAVVLAMAGHLVHAWRGTT